MKVNRPPVLHPSFLNTAPCTSLVTVLRAFQSASVVSLKPVSLRETNKYRLFWNLRKLKYLNMKYIYKQNPIVPHLLVPHTTLGIQANKWPGIFETLKLFHEITACGIPISIRGFTNSWMDFKSALYNFHRLTSRKRNKMLNQNLGTKRWSGVNIHSLFFNFNLSTRGALYSS